MPMRWQDRQTLAEKMDFRERYEELCRIMEKEYDVLLINQDIQNKVKSRLEKNQRDYVLREQMKLSVKNWAMTCSLKSMSMRRNWKN